MRLLYFHNKLNTNNFDIFDCKPAKMKKQIFKALAKLNKKIFPSYSKKGLDLQKASKVQMAIIGWKLWVTKNSLS